MTFAVIREIIYLVSIVGGVAFYIAGQAKDKEYIQKDITQIKTDQKEILKALENIDNKFLNQA